MKTVYTAGAAGEITGLDGAQAIVLTDTANTNAATIHALKDFMDAAAESAGATVSTISLTNVTSLTGPAIDLLAVFAAGASGHITNCLLYTSPSPRDYPGSRMPSSA